MRSRLFTLAALVCSFGLPQLRSQNLAPAVEVPVFEIHPGKTAKAEVDLRFGEPLRTLDAEASVHLQAYDYPAPREAPDAERLVVSYFTDTWEVARVDVRLKAPLPADPLREQFGTRVVSRDIQGGGHEELYYPRLQGLIFQSNAVNASASAISYLSQRWLADYFVDRFNEHSNAQRNDDARFAAEKAVIIAPDYARGYVAEGIYFWNSKDFAEAKVRFLAGANAASGPLAKSSAHLWLARLYLDQEKQVAQAETEYRKALQETPSSAEAHLRYGQFLVSKKRQAEAVPDLTRAVELDAKNMDARSVLADTLAEQKRFDDEYPHLKILFEWIDSGGAANDARRRNAIYRRYAEALWPGRGQPQRQAFGKPQQALEIYEKAAQADPRDSLAFFVMGEIHRELGDPAKAVECYRNGIQRNPKSFDLQRGLALALLENGRYAEARQVAEDSVPIASNSAAFQMVQVARAWSALRDKKHALLWLQKAADSGYKDRQFLTSDRYLAALQDNGDFKKILLRMP
jgi:tetratricopeptide (TPR) repeat protein